MGKEGKIETRTWNIHDTNRMIASLTSGFVQSMVGHPIDCIKVAMQRTARENHPTSVKQPKGFIGTTIRMYRESGLKAFYRGALSPSIGTIIYNTSIAHLAIIRITLIIT